MLSVEEQQEIEQSIGNAPRRMAVSEALRVVQRKNGWISDEQIQEIAQFLHMTPSEVDSVATFYSHIYRRPVGRHVICICDSVSCHIMGYKSLHEHIQKRLGISFGQTTPDNLITYLPCSCLGHCEQAPVIMLDGRIIGHITPEKLDMILEELGWNNL
jgi:NADH-quinone oxidoreductase subunit E